MMLCLLTTILPLVGYASTASAQEIYFPSGLKFGNATDHEVVVWARISTIPPGDDPLDPHAATPGCDGEVRFRYRTLGQSQGAEKGAEAGGDSTDGGGALGAWISTEWMPVEAARDGTAKATLRELAPGTKYEIIAEAKHDHGRDHSPTSVGTEKAGSFRTAPASDDARSVRFAVLTCQKFVGFDDGPNGFRTYRTLAGMDLDFISHTGDAVYYDQEPVLAKSVQLARLHWHRMYGLPNLVQLHSHTVCYFVKDDHDTLKDDCWPGMKYGDLSFEKGVSIHREQNPVSETPFRTVRWGKHLQVWFAEGREYRVPNTDADGPGKTIWGKPQLDWFTQTVEASDATFKILVQATPLVGPDRKRKNDNHANAGFRTEGNLLRELAAKHQVISINGDRHWQYVTKDPESGVWEFGTGPVHDARAQGWNAKDRRPEHRFLRVKGGFLLGTVDVAGESVRLTLSHHDVQGNVTHTESFTR